MVTLSPDPELARREMHGLIFYLTTVSFIDGEFDPTETSFVRDTIRRVIQDRVSSVVKSDDSREREDLVRTLETAFEALFEATRKEVTQVLHEAVAEAEAQEAFVACRLEQRCFEIFSELDPSLHQAFFGLRTNS